MLDASYWTNRYLNQSDHWDIGYASPAIIHFVLENFAKETKILIPGAGNAHEAAALFNAGYTNVWVLDLSEVPLKRFAAENPKFPSEQLIQGDFFTHNSQYELILEQTFFCAIDPSLRQNYATKMHELLYQKGHLAGLWFARVFEQAGPPFGGNWEEYESYFKPYFTTLSVGISQLSIKAREGNEYFLHFEKR